MIAEFKGYLLSNNIEVEIANDSAVIFRKDGLSFLFQHSTDDPYYFRLSLPKIAQASEIRNVHDIINELCIQYKVMKMTVVEDELWIITEQFVYCRENINSLFSRLISLIEEVFRAFREAIKHNDENR